MRHRRHAVCLTLLCLTCLTPVTRCLENDDDIDLPLNGEAGKPYKEALEEMGNRRSAFKIGSSYDKINTRDTTTKYGQ